MKILIPILGFGKAGGYRVLSELANAWRTAGHDVCFLAPDSSPKPYFPTLANIIWVNSDGVLSQCSKRCQLEGWKYNLRAIYRGIKGVGQNYYVILGNHNLTSWPIAFARCGNAQKIYYVQAYEPEYYLNRRTVAGYVLAAAAAVSYHLPLKIISNAPIYLCYRNLRSIDYVPPGLDLSIFRPAEEHRILGDDKRIIIGCIGRKEPEKGTIYVLRAFEQLFRIDSRFLLRVAYGNLPPEWCHEACQVVVPRNDHELADYYRSLDILVAPGTAQHGAAHYPVLEALACGIPVVTTGYLGATEATAWLTKNKDADAVRDTIIAMIANPQEVKEKATNGLRVIRDYAWPDVANRFLRHFL